MNESRASFTDTFGPFVMVPQDYIDRLMPALLESEWRVLLVILRQTLGWVAAESHTGRKERDWISMGQFAQRTGLHRDSISRAVQRLVEMGLIRVESQAGRTLDSPVSRKQHGARLYYRLMFFPTHEQALTAAYGATAKLVFGE